MISLHQEISKVNDIYLKVRELESIISYTDVIHSIEELKEIQEQIDKLNQMEDTYTNRSNNCTYKLDQKSYENKKELESKINLSKKKIEKIYTHYIGKSYGGKKFYIIALELYKFHLEKKKDLKEIYDIYKSKESIEKLLSDLLERRRGEKKAITFNITREIIKIQSVKSDLLEKECLSLKSFLKK